MVARTYLSECDVMYNLDMSETVKDLEMPLCKELQVCGIDLHDLEQRHFYISL